MSINEPQKKKMEKLKSNEYMKTTRKKEQNKKNFQEKRLRIW